MFYEGTEKRLFIYTDSLNLFDLKESFWRKLVSESGAEILSSITNNQVKAYLLSESSLFIWKNKLLLITCGNTQLVKAALFIQQQLTKEKITTLLFQRHHPLKPQQQSSNFHQDSLLLAKKFNGYKQHWKNDYQGDIFIFGDVSSNVISPHSIYMLHGLSGELATKLQQQSLDKRAILANFKLETFFDGLSIDHFSFEPKGYSLNAIKGEDYLTIHLTPEKYSTYLSVETSLSNDFCIDFIHHLNTIFVPNKMKRMHFKATPQELSIHVL